MVMLALTLILILAVQLVTLRRLHVAMSKTNELTAAVDKVVAFIDTIKNQSTPDSELQPQIDRLNAAVPTEQPPQQ